MPLGKEAGLCPDHIVLDGEPVGTQRPPQQPIPTFRPVSIVAKWSPISATSELLYPLTLTLLTLTASLRMTKTCLCLTELTTH